MSQKPSQIIDNIKTAIPAVAKAIKGNWDNIQSLNIKTNSSVSLPIWSCTLDDAEGGRWHGLEVESDEEEGSDLDDEDEEEVIVSKKAPAAKGKKRPSSSDEEDEEVEEQPKKKSKAANGSSSAKLTPSAPSSKKVKAEPSPSASATASKKLSKGKPISAPAPEVAVPVKAASKPTASSGKKGSKASVLEISSKIEAPLKKKTATSADVDATISPTTKPKSDKKKAPKDAPVPVAAVSEKIATLNLTKDELKQKRSAAASSKKKELVTKSKGAKSAKNAVLGRKAGQE